MIDSIIIHTYYILHSYDEIIYNFFLKTEGCIMGPSQFYEA